MLLVVSREWARGYPFIQIRSNAAVCMTKSYARQKNPGRVTENTRRDLELQFESFRGHEPSFARVPSVSLEVCQHQTSRSFECDETPDVGDHLVIVAKSLEVAGRRAQQPLLGPDCRSIEERGDVAADSFLTRPHVLTRRIQRDHLRHCFCIQETIQRSELHLLRRREME